MKGPLHKKWWALFFRSSDCPFAELAPKKKRNNRPAQVFIPNGKWESNQGTNGTTLDSVRIQRCKDDKERCRIWLTNRASQRGQCFSGLGYTGVERCCTGPFCLPLYFILAEDSFRNRSTLCVRGLCTVAYAYTSTEALSLPRLCLFLYFCFCSRWSFFSKKKYINKTL